MKKAIGDCAAIASLVLIVGSFGARAAAADEPGTTHIDTLEHQVQTLDREIQGMKQSTMKSRKDLDPASGEEVHVALKGGRPTLATADGQFSIALRSLVQYDSAYYSLSHAPSRVDFSSGNNFRRARFGADGTLFRDWSYEFVYDFGASGTESGGRIYSAFIQFDGLGAVHVKVGAFPPPESFEDSTSSSDLLFLERAQPADVARSIAGSPGRDSATAFAYDDNDFGAFSYTGGIVGAAGVFDEQQALVGRLARRLAHAGDSNLAVDADSTYVLSLAPTAGAGSPNPFSLSERPELSVDSNSTRLVNTNTIDAKHVLEWGIETAGNWHQLYAQGGYFGFDVTRRASVLQDPSFDGWYAQSSWILTGEAKVYRSDRGAYAAPKPAHPYTLDRPGIGAWELAARYSALNLNSGGGIAGLSTPPGGIRGGEQKIWTVGVNWYPNTAIRFQLDFQHADVSRLSTAGANIGANLNAVSLRAQLSL